MADSNWLGVQPFPLPMNAVKKETSYFEKVMVVSHDEDGVKTQFDFVVDSRVHTRSFKVKFFLTGFRSVSEAVIHYIGEWVELESQEYYLRYPDDAIPDTFFIGFYPYKFVENGEAHAVLSCIDYATDNEVIEVYIEKVSIIDSDFDDSISWLNDEDKGDLFTPKPGSEPTIPDEPVGGTNIYNGNNWPW